MACDILNVEWASRGRDIDIVEPVLVYLELRYGLDIERASIADFELMLWKHKPKMVLIAGAIGADINVEVVKAANKMGRKAACLISEGDYPLTDTGIKDLFWGWNKDEIFYQDLQLNWNSRSVKQISEQIPGAKNFNIKVSGATGFDRYKFLQFLTKDVFLRKYGKTGYGKVAGIAEWNFGGVFGEHYERNKETMANIFGEETVSIHQAGRDVLRQTYRDLIKNNPGILFVLKQHPGSIDQTESEFYGLEGYPNVVAISRHDENVADAISVSDIWVAYESTTCLEAWLMGKQTMLVNPLGGDFRRSRVASGSPIKTNLEQVQSSLDAFYAGGEVPGFAELAPERHKIISDIIQWDDGKNHIRAGEYIYEELLRDTQKKTNYDGWLFAKMARAGLAHIALKTSLQNTWPISRMVTGRKYLHSIYNYREREEIRDRYETCLRKFYKTNGMTADNPSEVHK